MTPDDVRVVIATMKAMWPNQELGDHQAQRWVQNLSPLVAEDVEATVIVLERSLKFWPTWAEFVEVNDQMVRRRRQRDTPAIGPARQRQCTPEENATWVAHCRDILANAKGPLAKGFKGWMR